MQDEYYYYYFNNIKETWALCSHWGISYYGKKGLKINRIQKKQKIKKNNKKIQL